MLKILTGFEWLEALGENTKEIEECLEKGLIKYIHDESRPCFIMLESNTTKVEEILKDDYDLLDEMTFLEWIRFEYEAFSDIEVENLFNNTISLSIDSLIDLIEDEEETYFPDDIKLEIYNDKNSNGKIFELLNELGRDQIRLQIRDLLRNVEDQSFR